jgi:hypothetical protein
MKLILLAVSCVVSLSAFADKHKHSHRQHGTHVHGAGNLGIAFDGLKGKVDLKITGESIFGFERVAKKDQDKKTVADSLAKLESKISEMLVFDLASKCAITKDKIEVLQNGKHSDVVASYNVLCEKSPLGTEITFNFQTQFPRIKDLDVDVIVDNLQRSVEVKTSDTKLVLK